MSANAPYPLGRSRPASKFARDALDDLPEPDGTALGNLRHVVAAFADSDPAAIVVQATSNVYPEGHPGVITTKPHGATFTGLTHADLRELLDQLDGH